MTTFSIDNRVENLLINKDKNHCSCKGTLSDEMIAAIKNYECLSAAFTYGQWPDLSFLNKLSPYLRRLTVQSEDVDWESIGTLSTLKELTIDGAIKGAVDFTKLTGLKSLQYHWDKKNSESVFNHEGIEHLIIYGVKAQDFTVFKKMSSLKRLEVVRGNFISLDGVDELKNIRSLQLDSVSKLEDISALNEVSNLIDLGFGSCNKVSFPENIAGLRNLREFRMLKQKNVSSLNFIASLPKLEVLKVFEMSIKDGDIQFLQGLSSLKTLLIDSKRHYNFDVDAFAQILKNKYGDYEIDIFDTIGIDRF